MEAFLKYFNYFRLHYVVHKRPYEGRVVYKMRVLRRVREAALKATYNLYAKKDISIEDMEMDNIIYTVSLD